MVDNIKLLIDGDLQEELKRLLHYSPTSGIFTRRVTTSSRSVKGARAGTSKSRQYRVVRFNGRYYLEHRLAFLYMLGSIPKMVDHINRDKLDNRWDNLRASCAQTNQYNRKVDSKNTSGHSGVSWDKRKRRWHVRFNVGKKNMWFGAYKDLELAALVAQEARDKHHGSFIGET